MAHSSTPVRRRRTVIAVLAFLLVGGTTAVAIVQQASPTFRNGVAGIVDKVGSTATTFEETSEHGFIATGQTIELSDEHLPSIANLDPDLLAAAREAADAAEREQGIHLVVTSGWRSAAYQGWLLSQAIARYGSAEEAAKWVSKPEDSKHVTGEALDVGPFDGTLWMQSNASRFGLCQIYSNELWHYELATAYGDSCPPLRDSAAT